MNTQPNSAVEYPPILLHPPIDPTTLSLYGGGGRGQLTILGLEVPQKLELLDRPRLGGAVLFVGLEILTIAAAGALALTMGRRAAGTPFQRTPCQWTGQTAASTATLTSRPTT